MTAPISRPAEIMIPIPAWNGLRLRAFWDRLIAVMEAVTATKSQVGIAPGASLNILAIMIPVADAISVIPAIIATTATLVTIKTTTNPVTTTMFIGMIPITAGKTDMRIAETTLVPPGALIIAPETASIKRGLAMTKDVPAVPASAIHLCRNLL